jgi:hypothetical protein
MNILGIPALVQLKTAEQRLNNIVVIQRPSNYGYIRMIEQFQKYRLRKKCDG